MKPIIISIDGNIGSGKSTFVQYLKEHTDYYVLDEPVDEWMKYKDESGTSLIENFYKNQTRWSYTFQNFAYITRLKKLKDAIDAGHPIIITERSIFTDKNIFAKMLYEDNRLNKMEWDMYNYWFDFFKMELDGMVYLHTSPEICRQRIQQRARQGEEGIQFRYLQELHHQHEKVKKDCHYVELDGNQNFIKDETIRNELLEKVKTFINKL